MCAVTKVANASGLVKRKENKTGPFREFHVIVLESNPRKQRTFRNITTGQSPENDV